jgi:hypothetical protein
VIQPLNVFNHRSAADCGCSLPVPGVVQSADSQGLLSWSPMAGLSLVLSEHRVHAPETA